MLPDSEYTTRTAGDREAGARCPLCSASIALGEQIVGCGRCGAVHHELCWQTSGGCGSFECAPARRDLPTDIPPSLRISGDEVSRVQLPRPRVVIAQGGMAPPLVSVRADAGKTSVLAVIAAIVALAATALPVGAFLTEAAAPKASGLMLIGGIITGVAAILLGSIALGGIHQSGRRGVLFGVGGIVLGLIGMGGSIAVVALSAGGAGHLSISIDQFEPDADSLNHMIPTVARAVRANALIEIKFGGGILSGSGIGSGVIMLIENGSALVLTNRHVVDPEFKSQESVPDKPGLPDGHLQVKLIGQPPHPGRVVWIAPDEIDLALVRVDVDGTGAEAAEWDGKTDLLIGSEVFTVGNPEHLDWTQTRGSISQFRLQQRGTRQIHIIQTDAALNHGNSGGGLYDKSGKLIGINTWIDANQGSKGLGFSIALSSLLALDPPGLHEPAEKAAVPEKKAPKEKQVKKPAAVEKPAPAADEDEEK